MLMPPFVLYIFMSIPTTFFLESANPVALVVLAAASVATLGLAVASDCRAAASAAAAAARHACCVCVSFCLSYITLTLPPRT